VEQVYQELAQALHRIPNGFPATKSGVELKILARLFSPQEAKLACYLEQEPQSPQEVSQKIGWEERETYQLLKGMLKKGLIEAERGKGGFAFKLIPFIVGFYENQNAKIDQEFAQLFEQYYRESLHQMMAIKPSVHRVIPIEKTIPMNVEVMPYERASHYIENAQSWGVLPCICRVQKRLIGKGCHHSEENCLVLSKRPRAFRRTEAIRAISKEEALQILIRAGEEGLIHSTGNTQEEISYICNCCTCSCGVLRGIADFGHVNAVGSSEFYAVVDPTLCTGCGNCISRCQFHALEIKKDTLTIDLSRCYGCGQCITACPTGALTLQQKKPEDIETPPITEEQWREQRQKGREGLSF
jgi:electron transport complex protein RnfB